ncbi:type IV pilin protein [Vibrio galatheae]|nr:type IV pilin protein [Vibrio galatheae]
MTLVELLIAVAIVSILTTFAYPSYQAYQLKAHRTAALADLAKVQLELESHYRSSYQSAASAVIVQGVCQVCSVDKDHFSISISATESHYTIYAVPQGIQNNDLCSGSRYNQLSLNQLGEIEPESCWQ